MDLLTALGLNKTVGIQFVVFVVVYFLVSRLVFRPYYAAFLKRNERTVGNTESAERLLGEAKELEDKFQVHARELNVQIKQVYDSIRTQAQREYEVILTKARQRSKGIIDETRAKAAAEMQRVKPEIKAEAATLSSSIVQKLLGKDLAV